MFAGIFGVEVIVIDVEEVLEVVVVDAFKSFACCIVVVAVLVDNCLKFEVDEAKVSISSLKS